MSPRYEYEFVRLEQSRTGSLRCRCPAKRLATHTRMSSTNTRARVGAGADFCPRHQYRRHCGLFRADFRAARRVNLWSKLELPTKTLPIGPAVAQNLVKPRRLPKTVYEVQRADGVASEKAILVRVILPGQTAGDDPLDEMTGLAKTAGTRIVSGLMQRREAPDVTTYLGKGKVEELKALVEHHDADVVIFDNDLAPSQTRNLEQTARRQGARPHRADPRHLRQQRPDVRSPPGGRAGPARVFAAAAEADVDPPVAHQDGHRHARPRRKAARRGPPARREADPRPARPSCTAIERRKERQVASRSDRLTVSLVGYTNAGKSTLMNALTGAGVLAAGQAVRHARHPHPPLAAAELGAGAACPTRSASSATCRTA